MLLLIEKISQLGFGWNERPLGEADFYLICKRLKIRVIEMPLRVSGFYYRVMGQDFIAIDSRLSGYKKLAVLFHELGHYLFHTPESGATANFHGVGHRTRKECEADIFAFCALIPRCWLTHRDPQQLIEDDGFPIDIITERYRVFERYNI